MVNYDLYDYIIFTNDSYIIHYSLDHFFNLIIKKDVELYGYNDSFEKKYHIQSYLFALKNSAISSFIKNVEENFSLLKTLQNVIVLCELEFTNWFQSHACFLDITTLKCQQKICGSNIFYHHDDLYIALKEKGLLPFTKLKRLNNYSDMPNISCSL